MEISIIVTFMIIGIIIQHLLKIKEEKEERMEQENENMIQQKSLKPDTIGLMFNILSALGCQPTKNDDESLFVSYQGENFYMEFGAMYARVWDPMWSGIKVDDAELSEVREAVNAANFNFGPRVVMTPPDDEGVIGFHSRRDIMLPSDCLDNVPFVKAVLDSFFDAKENVRTKYQQLKTEQIATRKNRQPIGFTTNMNTDKSE